MEGGGSSLFVDHSFSLVFLKVATVSTVRLHYTWKSDCYEGDVRRLSHLYHGPETFKDKK